MDATHIHLLLNHVPIFTTILATALFLYAFVRGSDELKRLSMILLVLGAAVAIPVYLTGEPAEEVVERLAGVDEGIISEHESAAKISLIVVMIAGSFSLLGMILMRSRREIAKWFVLAALAFGAIAAASMARTGNLGGQIRHSEIRGASATSAPAQEDRRSRGRDDDDH